MDGIYQPWYDDDAGVMSRMDEIDAYFTNLNALGPKYGYFPEPTKSVLVVKPDSVEMAKEK